MSKRLGFFTTILALAFSSNAFCETFDWRAYPGTGTLPAGNYVTPVRNQQTNSFCWSFAATACLEANYAITTKTTNPAIDLSEQTFICVDHDANPNMIIWEEDDALNYCIANGATTEAKLPYTQARSSPNWPLAAPYTLYRVTSIKKFNKLNADPASLKSELKTYGPICAEINSATDFCNPTSPSSFVGDGSQFDHSALIVGFADNASFPGGGYYIIKNSEGAGWGPTFNGYGYINYSTMQNDDYLTAIDGTSYTVAVGVPEPATLLLSGIGGIALLRRKR